MNTTVPYSTPQNKHFYTYGIYYPEDYSISMKAGTMFYAGKGTGKRTYQTLNRCKQGNTRKARIVRKIWAEEKHPIVIKLAEFDNEQDALFCEIAYIFLMPQLSNITIGGEGVSGYRPSPEAISKTVNARRGLKFPPEWRENLSKANKGIKPTPQTIAAVIAANNKRKGVPTPEYKRIKKAVENALINGEITVSLKSIAKTANVSYRTVKNHIPPVKKELGIAGTKNTRKYVPTPEYERTKKAVADFLVNGKLTVTLKAIADTANVSHDMVKKHIATIKKELGEQVKA